MRFLGRPPVTPRTALAARLLKLREATSGEDRDRFAMLTGISKSTIGNYERGDRVPDADMLNRYRAASGVSGDWLISGEGEMFPAAAVIVILILNRKVFMKVDYALLATFCAFFVFVGNMKRIDAVSEILQANIVGNEYWWGLGMSQIISNVPAAIMLSGFASDIKALLLGVDVGGLGTLIASLASLISFKGYTARRKGEGLYYLGVFTLWNLVFLAVLAPLSYFALKVF